MKKYKKRDKIIADEYIEEKQNNDEPKQDQEPIENINYSYDGEYDDAENTSTPLDREKKIKRKMNIIFAIIVIIMIMITIDVICVARYDVGPFFAIRTNVYKDGGTKVYYGFGYKVIKYNQVQGRRDTKIGFWTMPYSIEPTTISSLDLAIEFRNKPEETSKKYYKQFLRITGKVKKLDNKSHKITIEYTDPDEKYTLQILCSMAEKETLAFQEQEDISIIGTAKEFKLKTKKMPNTLYMNDCFASNGVLKN